MFVLSLIRLYVLVKQFRNWNIYTNGRGEKIAKFFNNNEMLMFLYRTNLKNNGALTLALIFITLALVGGYVLKVFENHQPTESQSNFGDFWTCLWFIAQTMTTSILFSLYFFSWIWRSCPDYFSRKAYCDSDLFFRYIHRSFIYYFYPNVYYVNR